MPEYLEERTMATRREGKVQNPSWSITKLFIQLFVFQNPLANSPWPGNSNQFWKTFADIDTTDINGIDMGKNKESRRNAKRSRDAAIFGRVEQEKMARKISHVMRDEITALLPQKQSKNRQKYHSTDEKRYIKNICSNRLITVLEAMLSGRQPREKIVFVCESNVQYFL